MDIVAKFNQVPVQNISGQDDVKETLNKSLNKFMMNDKQLILFMQRPNAQLIFGLLKLVELRMETTC
jgi:hypothetical protein